MTFADQLPNMRELITIFGMFVVTYSTRITGWLLLRNRTVSPRLEAVLKASPGCVMAAIVAPAFVTQDLKMLAALLLTCIYAKFTPLPVTVAGSIATYAALHAALA